MSLWEWLLAIGVMGLLAFLVVAIVLLVCQLERSRDSLTAWMKLQEEINVEQAMMCARLDEALSLLGKEGER